MEKKTKKTIIISSVVTGVVGISVLLGLVFTGRYVGWGPFSYLAFNAHINNILKKYDSDTRKQEIVFYGASNFRLWEEMEEDMNPYIVQNHGFGGSTDVNLVEQAEKLLYPYEPQIVVFQTGSNDYASKTGSDEEKIASGMEYKKEMFSTFHERLPNAQFVVMAGILMPGRSQYDEIVKQINKEIKEYSMTCEYLTFVDSEQMTVNEDGTHKNELFIKDGIHLTHEARIMWANDYIKPTLKTVIGANNIQGVTR